MLGPLLPIASFAETKEERAVSAERWSYRRACTLEDEGRDRVGEIRLGLSCCLNLFLVDYRELAAAFVRFASMATASNSDDMLRFLRISFSHQVGTTAAPPVAWARILS